MSKRLYNGLKIGEFSEILGVSVQTLRNYDKLGILSPSFRSEGCRYYDIDKLGEAKKKGLLIEDVEYNKYRKYKLEIGKPENVFGYVYMNYYIDTDMWYIGQHKADCFDWNYLGSGEDVVNSISLGILKVENICSMILDWGISREDLDVKELYWTEYFDVMNNDKFYNKILGGNYNIGAETARNRRNSVRVRCIELDIIFPSKRCAAEFVDRSVSSINNAIEGITKTCAGYHWECIDVENQARLKNKLNKENISKNFGDRAFGKGSKHSESNKVRMSELKKGTICTHIYTDEERKRASDRQMGRNNSFYNHKHTEESKKLMSIKVREAKQRNKDLSNWF